MIRIIDRISTWMARLSAWMFFAIGLMVTWEVVTRKVFNSPTIWVDETARFFQVWAVYLAAAHILKNRDMIVVEIIPVEGHPLRRRLLDSITLAIVGVFSFVAMKYGFDILMESIRMGRHTSTMLGVPKWMTESSIPAGFGLLLAQAVAEFVKLWRPGGGDGAYAGGGEGGA